VLRMKAEIGAARGNRDLVPVQNDPFPECKSEPMNNELDSPQPDQPLALAVCAARPNPAALCPVDLALQQQSELQNLAFDFLGIGQMVVLVELGLQSGLFRRLDSRRPLKPHGCHA